MRLANAAIALFFATVMGGLSACTPADAALDGDLEIAGMDPAFWGVKVERGQDRAVISINFEPDFTGSEPVKGKLEDGTITLTSATPKGDFVMRLTQGTCLSGLDNAMTLDWSVSVDWEGETWKGCAKPVAPAAPAPTPAAEPQPAPAG